MNLFRLAAETQKMRVACRDGEVLAFDAFRNGLLPKALAAAIARREESNLLCLLPATSKVLTLAGHGASQAAAQASSSGRPAPGVETAICGHSRPKSPIMRIGLATEITSRAKGRISAGRKITTAKSG